MTFSEAERDQIRTYLGYTRMYISANPFLEQAITSIQPISEGGSAPDSSIENAVRSALQQIAAIDTTIQNLEGDPVSLAVSGVPVSLSNGAVLQQDYSRAIRTLRRNGTNDIMKIATRLGVQPIRPYFYSDGLGSTEALTNDPFGRMPGFFRLPR